MINLIPNEEKKKTSRNFYLRLATMFFVIFFISVLIASVAILPSYFLSSVEKSSINNKLKLQEEEILPLPDQDTFRSVEDLKMKLSLIENLQKNNFIFSQKVINEIVLQKPLNIKITGIAYQNIKEKERKIDVEGLAKSREALLGFRHTLENNPAFSQVDLPISNFVKGSDIKFRLSLIPW